MTVREIVEASRYRDAPNSLLIAILGHQWCSGKMNETLVCPLCGHTQVCHPDTSTRNCHASTPDQENLKRWELALCAALCQSGYRWGERKEYGSALVTRCLICGARFVASFWTEILHARWHIAQLPCDEVAAFRALCEIHGTDADVVDTWRVTRG